jgi:enamine deaminase RidA (YjgF/YER057c/UK114 family)
MGRRVINPWTWQDQYGYAQAIEVTGSERALFCAGQTSNDADGNPVHAGDMAAQVGQALDNLEVVLREAGFELSQVVRLNTYTTERNSARRRTPRVPGVSRRVGGHGSRLTRCRSRSRGVHRPLVATGRLGLGKEVRSRAGRLPRRRSGRYSGRLSPPKRRVRPSAEIARVRANASFGARPRRTRQARPGGTAHATHPGPKRGQRWPAGGDLPALDDSVVDL